MEYVEQREQPVSVALPIGGAVHKGIEFARRRLIADRPWEIEEVIDVGADHFDRELREPGTLTLGRFETPGSAKDEVVRLLTWATPRLLELDAERGLSAVEVWVCSDRELLTEAERRSPHLPFDAVAAAFPCPVKGRLDAMYGANTRWVISDLKTASSKGAPQGAGIQLGFYVLPFLVAGHEAAGLIDVLVKTIKEPALQHYALGEVNQQTLLDMIGDVADCISEGYFPPRPGVYCSYDHGLPSLTMAVDGFREAA